MNTMRAFLLLVSLGAVSALFAQSVQFVVLDRQVNFVQTSAGTAAVTGSTPFEFVIDLNGSGLTSPAFTFVAPSTVTYPSFVRDPGKEWQAPGPEGTYQFATIGDLHAAFAGGTYTIQTNLGNTTLDIPNLIGSTNDGFPNMPFVSGTQNGNPVTWSGNRMIVDPTLELTLLSNVFSTSFNYEEGVDRIGMWVSGNSFDQSASNETAPNNFIFVGDTATLQITANSLAAGTYYGNVEFNNVVSSLVDLSGVYGSGANGVSVYTAFTRFEIQAIPEPSTYAAILGAVALAGVMIHRHRRRLA